MNISNALKIDYVDPVILKNYKRDLRKPSDAQHRKTCDFIQSCGGIYVPIIVDEYDTVVVGGHWAKSAQHLKLESVPIVRLSTLAPQTINLLRIAYDRLAEDAAWDKKSLAEEFSELRVLIPDLTITGFDQAEIDVTLDIITNSNLLDDAPEIRGGDAVTSLGDLFDLGGSRLFCGNALEESSYKSVIGETAPTMIFTDAPYNVCIDGHVGNSGVIQHREFVMGSGEMSDKEFQDFLTSSHQLMSAHMKDGGIIFSCMDWRHIKMLLTTGEDSDLELKNICVWAKDNAGMGSLYRSRHEMVVVFKKGKGKHINNVQLGKNGRSRSNVWEYPGVNTFGNGRMNELSMHPTVKPVAMVTDAIKDCSKRGDFILDPFAGSGTTLIAAEQSGRKAYLIELDPLYCDVIIRRWQTLTGKDAVHVSSGKTFNQLSKQE